MRKCKEMLAGIRSAHSHNIAIMEQEHQQEILWLKNYYGSRITELETSLETYRRVFYDLFGDD